ncbi:hypothetical protein GCM10023155_06760 [Bremerella cremea]|uniref:BBP7 family outer membrane beta-barrel protein n=2 Tax=Bremerella cremea TaxID=1031537 RepID=UPI00336FB591
MKLNYSTLAFSIVAMVLGTGRSYAQEGYAPMGYPYPTGNPAPYDPAGMQQPGMMPPGMQAGYAPPAMMGAPGAMPYAQMAAAPGGGTMTPGMQYAGMDPASMYEPAGDYVQYENVAGMPCDDCGDGCALPPRAYGTFDAMMVWRKGGNYPAILTTSDPADLGVLGQPSTQVLFGAGNETDGPSIGGRITLGLWLDDYQNWSVGGRFMALEEQSLGYTATSAQYPTLAYPFFNTNTMMQDSNLVALPTSPNFANSTVNIENRNSIYMGDFFVTKHIYTNHGNRWDFVTGYSYAKIEDNLYNNASFEVVAAGGSGFTNGDIVAYNDAFEATNEFHGGQFGLIAEFQDGPLSWRAMGKISVGNMRQEATINGSRTINGTPVAGGGVYALPSNIGSYDRDQFAYIPEANVEMLYALNCNLDFKIGATFIYFSDVVTGGTMINTNIDPSFGGTDPTFQFLEQEYWVLGMTLGVDYHY